VPSKVRSSSGRTVYLEHGVSYDHRDRCIHVTVDPGSNRAKAHWQYLNDPNSKVYAPDRFAVYMKILQEQGKVA
jgi:hypothetical protein